MLNQKNFLLVVAISLLICAAVAIVPNGLKIAAQSVPTNAALSGWAWSSNIGWIKVKSTGSEPAFGVRLNNGKLEGEAWSSSIGWIKFNPGPGPDGYPDTAGITGSNKDTQLFGTNLLGWARACSVFTSNSTCTGSLKDNIYRGGWDGWLKLGGGNFSGGVSLDANGKQLKGYAWGNEVLGWVKFNCLYRPDTTDDSNGCTVDSNGCSGVCIDTSSTSVNCTVSNPTPELGEDVDFTTTVTGASSPYNYNWQILGSPYWDQDSSNNSTYTITRSFNTPGVKTFSVNVVYGSSANNTAGSASCTATVDVQNENDVTLTVKVIGDGSVMGASGPIVHSGSTLTPYSFPYAPHTPVNLTGVVGAGGSYTWTSNYPTCSGTNTACNLTMDEDREVTIEFTTVPQYCVNVSYTQANSMQVNYQNIRNLDEPHRSTKAKVEVRRIPGADPLALPASVDLSLNLSALTNHPLVDPDDHIEPPRLEPDGSTFNIPMDSFKEVNIYYPSDGQPLTGFASPYAAPGIYQLPLDAGPNVEFCNRDTRPFITASYIDIRQREQ